MRELDVRFGNKRIHNKDFLELTDVQTQPIVDFKMPAGKYYTILMVDPDAPSHKDPINKHWLHWMIVNNNKTLVDFKPSSPPPSTGEHRYFICLLEQQNEINIPQIPPRKQFPVKKFIEQYKLKPIASVMYRTERQ